MDSAKVCKHVVSISLGSSARDAQALENFAGMDILVERRGTDGDMLKARQLLEYWDGRADAIGLGGTDLYVYAGETRYTFRESARLIANVRKTPVLDGSGLKNTLERRLIQELAAEGKLDLSGKRVLMVCGVDRFGMAEALLEAGCDVTFGDLLFGLGMDCPLKSLKALSRWARVLAPLVTRLPVSWFYPTGKEQEKRTPKFPQYFLENDIIAGDFHFIKKYMPARLDGKIIITNTVTATDRSLLKQAGVSLLITTTPCLAGRSFGTNVMEAMLVALQGAQQPLTAAEYLALLDKYKITSSVEYLNT